MARPRALGDHRFVTATISLRPAIDADASGVFEVLFWSRKEFLPYASPRTSDDIREWTRTVLIPGGGVDLAITGDEIVGVVATARNDGIGWITQLYVRPSCIGRGIGTLLISHALASLPRPVRLWCFQRNTLARRFYERRGFAPIRFTDGSANEERCPDVLYELS
jgi:GNAT superfamily N-acetyltransferase